MRLSIGICCHSARMLVAPVHCVISTGGGLRGIAVMNGDNAANKIVAATMTAEPRPADQRFG